MGYSDKLANNSNIPSSCKEQAKIIGKNSESIRELVNDLNISSKLEYDTHNLDMKIVYPIKLIRCVIADFLNSGIDESYSIELTTHDIDSNTNIIGDEFLLKRALNNLIQNSIKHNPNGCNININCIRRANYVFSEVLDNGIGVSCDKLEKVKSNEHYLLGNGNILEQHGLGLLIVKQIIKVHNGQITFKSQNNCGFQVTIMLEDTTVGGTRGDM